MISIWVGENSSIPATKTTPASIGIAPIDLNTDVITNPPTETL